MVDIQSATAEDRPGKKERTTAAKYNGLPYWAAIITIMITTKNVYIMLRSAASWT